MFFCKFAAHFQNIFGLLDCSSGRYLLANLNRFHKFLWCFYCGLRTSKCRLGWFKNADHNVGWLTRNTVTQGVSTKFKSSIPIRNYMFKVNNRNTRTRCEICSKLTMKTPEQRYWHHSGVFIVNFDHISHLVLVFLLLTLNR